MQDNVTFKINIEGNVFTVVGKLQGDFNQLVSVVDKVDNSVNNTFNSIKDKISNINLTSIITQVKEVSAGIAAMAKPGIGFGQGLADLSSITGTVGADLQELAKTARKVGKESGLGAAEALKSFTAIASQIEVDDIGLEGLKELQAKAITLAQASAMPLEEATNALAGTINQFGFEAGEAGRVINVLAAGSKAGGAEINDLAESFKVVGSQSAIAGVSLEETAGALEVLSKNNIKGSEAGTHLRNIILSLQTAFGADLKKMTLTEALDQLKPKMEDATFMSQNFGRMSMASAQFLIKNAEAIGEMTAKVTGTDTALEQAAVRTETISQMMERCRAKVDDLKIGFFEATGSFGGYATIIGEQAVTIAQLLPLLTLMGKGIRMITDAEKLHVLWAGVVKGATVAWTGVQWALNAALWASPITWIVAGIAALVTGIVLAWNKLEGFRKAVLGVWEVMKEFGRVLLDSVLGAVRNLLSGIGSLGSAIAKLFKGDFKGAWQDAKSGADSLFKASPVGAAVSLVKNVAGADFSGAWDRGQQKGAESWAESQARKDGKKSDVSLELGEDTLAAIVPGSGLKINLNGKGGRKGSGSGSGSSPTLDLNSIVPDMKGTTSYSAIASRLSSFRTSAITAAASLALPLTVAATTLPLTSDPALDPNRTEYMGGAKQRTVSMPKFCDKVEIHIANADEKGYDQIRTEIAQVIKQVFDDYGA